MCTDKNNEEDIDVSEWFDIRSHNGYVTIENTKTGDHRTFKIWTENWGSKENPDKKRVLALLTGPDRDNYDNWKRFAFVGQSGIHLWSRFKSKEYTNKYEKFVALLLSPEAGHEAGLNYIYEGRCRRCNRALTVPSSVRKGIGPVCEQKESESA